MKWTAPADDGGSPITAYRVVILKTGTEIKNKNITDPGTTSLSLGSLERDTEYNVNVFARNAIFEGSAGEKTVRTTCNYEGKGLMSPNVACCLLAVIDSSLNYYLHYGNTNIQQSSMTCRTPV